MSLSLRTDGTFTAERAPRTCHRVREQRPVVGLADAIARSWHPACVCGPSASRHDRAPRQEPGHRRRTRTTPRFGPTHRPPAPPTAAC